MNGVAVIEITTGEVVWGCAGVLLCAIAGLLSRSKPPVVPVQQIKYVPHHQFAIGQTVYKKLNGRECVIVERDPESVPPKVYAKWMIEKVDAERVGGIAWENCGAWLFEHEFSATAPD